MFSILLLAGGIGSRFKSQVPKQFLTVGGTFLAAHSFNLFQNHPSVSEIIVVCAKEYRPFFPTTTLFADPGKRRQDSVFNALQLVSNEWVAIHDAARPFITHEDLDNLFSAAIEYGAATLGVPVTATIKESRADQTVNKTLEREKIWEIHTPQALQKKILEEGFAKAHGRTVTDDTSLAELAGYPVKLVPSQRRNLKITTPEDLIIAEALFATV